MKVFYVEPNTFDYSTAISLISANSRREAQKVYNDFSGSNYPEEWFEEIDGLSYNGLSRVIIDYNKLEAQ